MKNLLFVCLLLIGFTQVKAQNYLMTVPEGFGAATTGGGDANPVMVSTYDELKTELSSTSEGFIMVSGTITIPAGGYINAVIKNKTLLGLPGAKLLSETQTQSGSGIMNLSNGSTNVIIRNLIFEGPGAYDIDGHDNLTANGCTNLWVDHCEFRDGMDGNFDIKGKSDNVTVSWCKFTYLKPPTAGGSGGSDDHRYTDLVGSSKTDAPADGHFSVTFMANYWADGCKERMPRARNAELHILNCYYNTSVSGSLAIGLGGGINNTTCYVEGTNFAQIGNVYKSYISTDGGTVAINFVDFIKGKADIDIVSAPDYEYSLMPVEKVEAAVTNETCGAGATLQVSLNGEISVGCEGIAYYKITTALAGTGLGTIELNPKLGSYEAGTEVIITAVPDGQSIFDSWGGDLTGITNPTTINITDNMSIHATFSPVTAINFNAEEALAIFPTIVDDVFYIQFNDDMFNDVNIQLISISGKIVYSKQYNISAKTMEINPGSLSKGIYFCKVRMGNTSTTHKLIKQ